MRSGKVKKWSLLSFRRKPESRENKQFWTPAPVPDLDPGFAGVTALKTFYKAVKGKGPGKVVIFN